VLKFKVLGFPDVQKQSESQKKKKQGALKAQA